MSEQREELKTADAASNGKTYLNDKPASPVYYRSVGRVCEILAVASLAMCVFVYGLGLEKILALVLLFVLLIAFSIVMYKLAIKYAVSARMAEKAFGEGKKTLATVLRYKVTDARLMTLKEAGIPYDVRNALEKLKEQSPLPEEKFLAELALNTITDLGWERTNEFREEILKYTKVDRKSDMTPSKSIVMVSTPVQKN